MVYCATDYEKKPKRIFKEGVVLLVADGLLYLMAGWTIRGLPSLSNGQFYLGDAWSPINFEGAMAIGYYILFLGILVTTLAGFCLVLFGAGLGFKGWIEKLHHTDTSVSAGTERQPVQLDIPKVGIITIILGSLILIIAAFAYGYTETVYFYGVPVPTYPYRDYTLPIILCSVAAFVIGFALMIYDKTK